jgi:hypothetical protein
MRRTVARAAAMVLRFSASVAMGLVLLSVREADINPQARRRGYSYVPGISK